MGCSASSGAKDCGTFLQSKADALFPLPSSITHEGIFYQHYFDVPPTKEDILKVNFSTATTKDPISKGVDHFLCMGTSSRYDGVGLEKLGGRPPVQLMFVLDVSGSMSSPFRGQSGKEHRAGIEGGQGGNVSKLDAAVNSLLGLLENLKPGDYFGLVTFNQDAELVIPLSKCEGDFKEKTKKKLKTIKAGGGTNLNCGFATAVSAYDGLVLGGSETDKQIERRVFFLTDMMMTCGNSGDLLTNMKMSAEESRPVYSTIIGFGFDFDVDLAMELTKIPLCNSFSVHSSAEFLHQMTFEFDYLVFPIVKNLRVTLTDPNAAEIVEMCGSPTDLDEFPPGTLMVSTGIFPSQTLGNSQEASKGSIILAKLKLKESESKRKTLGVKVEFTDFEGLNHSLTEEVRFKELGEKTTTTEGDDKEEEERDVFDDLGVRKGVLLARYVVLMREYLRDIHACSGSPSLNSETGILFGKRKRSDSLPHTASNRGGRVCLSSPPPCQEEYRELLSLFGEYFKKEEVLFDDTELAVWRTRLLDFASQPNSESNSESNSETNSEANDA
eukprot:CAMPEP_0201494578 /NCGR_PEP_ID=MMETSP0151_2-20130828/48498_1 /ASSEMBLY_ACC=CAM_ASM_000257 /TAXON_ID=200890 /ORGANISM="Paramoeba atlantica, Strain 621/1 / CCAP 1560/9" /LENGTH=553 /DNA_ID=CAMNT_0047882937 /DNA_START=72 /DNA_END=1733 /DNA_ORIENTATION=+